jgi:hypothetical protein
VPAPGLLDPHRRRDDQMQLFGRGHPVLRQDRQRQPAVPAASTSSISGAYPPVRCGAVPHPATARTAQASSQRRPRSRPPEPDQRQDEITPPPTRKSDRQGSRTSSRTRL